mmetsp:Transcript_26269/g.69017  ORF Transcript_26269/g.69017 Transcript_26269/m.69017 type:complete len:246 (+) Transcript_26269:88-825(+)
MNEASPADSPLPHMRTSATCLSRALLTKQWSMRMALRSYRAMTALPSAPGLPRHVNRGPAIHASSSADCGGPGLGIGTLRVRYASTRPPASSNAWNRTRSTGAHPGCPACSAGSGSFVARSLVNWALNHSGCDRSQSRWAQLRSPMYTTGLAAGSAARSDIHCVSLLSQSARRCHVSGEPWLGVYVRSRSNEAYSARMIRPSGWCPVEANVGRVYCTASGMRVPRRTSSAHPAARFDEWHEKYAR